MCHAASLAEVLLVMNRGYIRVTKAGPSEADQRESLAASGVDPAHLYVDDSRDEPPYRAVKLKERERIIREIEPGSRIVVVDLERIGVSIPDIIVTVRTIMEKGVSVLDLSNDRLYEGVREGDLLLDAVAAEKRRKSLRLEKARAVLVARGTRTGPSPKLQGEARAAAKRDYFDPSKTVRQVAVDHGVGATTLHRMFGDRNVPPGRRPKTSS
jgi:DNA invertase Pin-like site-specific DNA recombinase